MKCEGNWNIDLQVKNVKVHVLFTTCRSTFKFSDICDGGFSICLDLNNHNEHYPFLIYIKMKSWTIKSIGFYSFLFGFVCLLQDLYVVFSITDIWIRKSLRMVSPFYLSMRLRRTFLQLLEVLSGSQIIKLTSSRLVGWKYKSNCIQIVIYMNVTSKLNSAS